MAGPSWYDILGVERDATPEQIKAAWRAATDKFEPGTGASQFRLFNEAAEVLMDPEKRAAYDAELSDVEPVETPKTPDVEPVETPETPETPDVEPVETPETPDAEPVETPAARLPAARRVLASNLGLGILAVLAVASLVLATVVGVKLQHRGEEARSGPQASAAAARGMPDVLSYDYRRLEADRDRAAKYLTPSYKKIYTKNFNGLIAGTPQDPGGAEKSKTVVVATVLTTGVVDADRDRVRVLAFVNQTWTQDGKVTRSLANRVIATMVHRGDRWLIDKLAPIGAGY
ncbi:hypothetical protein EFK50_17325 [Nocardioides marmoriginsengisoli]|uniref:J domain-containing protein n=1 Tax=Nocardioides marmoriginsengisoli TaxID=661483 RepID=A0A3N0CDQ4_9ACTN|nr:J domain-containing protein [Nocardioides marmoriginsengisoli]RNL61133.1 hypothetical protein EFK50_17325 [Nocardioides marmoriginsengisoli]